MITRSKVVIYKPKVYIVNKNWVATMRDKYLALMRNGTWSLVSLPEGRKIIRCKWVFNIKENPDGTVYKYKPRQEYKSSKLQKVCIFPKLIILWKMQYVTTTRLEISFKVNKVHRFMQRPLASHRKAMKRILRLHILLIENQPQEKVMQRKLEIRHVQSQDQMADVLIKAISSSNFPALRHKRSELRITAL
ncbi:hypothetical protein AAG906_039434 [Vitis piasezkii]